MWTRHLGIAITLAWIPVSAHAQSSWDRYAKGTLGAIIASEDSGVRTMLTGGGTHVVISAAEFPTRATVAFLDSIRPTPATQMKVLDGWAKAIGSHYDAKALFGREALFREDSLRLWIPVYDSLIGQLEQEVRPGELATLYVTYHGATGSPDSVQWVFAVNDFSAPEPPFPPSQRELGGFLIGQSLQAIEASFVKRIQVDTAQDGWVDRAYLVDRVHHAYMAFKFEPDRPNAAVAVQVAGDSGAPLTGLLGVELGDSRDSLIARVGRPARITHEDDVNVDLFSYDGRNYSFEVDSNGRVSSIQIMGIDGFPDTVVGAAPSIEGLVTALKGDWSEALDALSPSVEVYPGRKAVVSFEHSARRDLTDTTSALRRLLVGGPRSFVRIMGDPSVRAKGESSVRVWEHGGVGLVWKFPRPIPITEVVMKYEMGRWVLWEVTYR